MSPLDAQLMQVGDRLEDFPGNLPYDFVAKNGWTPDGFLFKSTYATSQLLTDCEARGFVAGVWFDVHNDAGKDPTKLASDYSGLCTRVGIAAPNLRPVVFDWEGVGSLAWQATFAARWDFLRYARPTVYQVKPFADPSETNFDAITRRNVVAQQTLRKVSTETYDGSMNGLGVKHCLQSLSRFTGWFNATVDARASAGDLASIGSYGASGVVVFDAERTAPA